MKRLILIYGLIAGFIVALMMVLSMSGSNINFKYAEIIGYATMIIAFSTIFFAIKTYRDKQLDGVIGFGKAFRIGLGITLVATVIYVVAWMIISNTIAKDFMAEYYQHSVEQVQTSNMTEAEKKEELANMENMMEMYKNPIVKIGITFLEIFPVGLIITLISAFILQRKTTT